MNYSILTARRDWRAIKLNQIMNGLLALLSNHKFNTGA